MKVSKININQNEFNDCIYVDYRLSALTTLKSNILKYETELLKALKNDLNKSYKESFLCEINEVINELNFHIKKLKKWTTPIVVKNTYTTMFNKSYIIPKPKGKVLIIAPFNYPFNLSMFPLIGSISAGNKSLLKLSSLTPNTNNVIYKILDETFNKKHVDYIKPEEINDYNELFEYNPNMVFFTGSTKVGKSIELKCCANNIEYVTEMGGSCPCILLEEIDVFFQRIVWAKFLNAGQTCVSINYLLVLKNINWQTKLINEIKVQYPKPIINKNIPKIISKKAFDRILNILYKYKNNIIYGGKYDVDTLIIEPTIILVNDFNIIKQIGEVFAPILFVYEVDNLNQSIEIANTIDNSPLAAYLYSNKVMHQKMFFNKINAGGYCINDSITHILNHNLPFGGIYTSGSGNYHGYYSFKTFSFFKPVLKNNSKKDIPIKYINNNVDYKKTKKLVKFISKFIKG